MYVEVGRLPAPPAPPLGVAPEGDWHYIDAWEWTGFRWRRKQVPASVHDYVGEKADYLFERAHPVDVLRLWEFMRPPSAMQAEGAVERYGPEGNYIHRCYVYEYGVGWQPCSWVGTTR